MKISVVLALAVLSGVGPHSDQFGGWPNLTGAKTGWFHTQKIDGRWWLVTPDGNAFFSKGVDNVSYKTESDNAPKAPADPAAWAKGTSRQLREGNFNTAGAWSASRSEEHTS